MIGVIAVRSARVKYRWHGDAMKEVVELCEEGAIGIIVNSEIERVPGIGPPVVAVVDHISAIRCKAADDGLAAGRARHAVERAFIAPRPTPLHPALGAQRRRRDRDLFIEYKIIRLDGESILAILAGYSLGGHGY